MSKSRSSFWAKRIPYEKKNKTPFWDIQVPWNRNEWDKRGDFWGLTLPESEKLSYSVIF